jgi:hypothetical protein
MGGTVDGVGMGEIHIVEKERREKARRNIHVGYINYWLKICDLCPFPS